MKKIIDLIKSLIFGNGSVADKLEEVKQLETAVVEEVKVVEDKVKEVKAKVKKVTKTTQKAPAKKKATKK